MIKNFLLNLLLSLVWVALTGHLNYPNFLFGFILGFVILWVLTRTGTIEEKSYFYKVPKLLLFCVFFFYDMIRANIEVTKEILTPRFKLNPAVVIFEHRLKSDFEITMISNLIALTPGTMVLKISPDKKYLYIHSFNLKDKDKFSEHLRNGLEKKLIEVIR